MISRGIKVHQFAQIDLILEAKFGDEPLALCTLSSTLISCHFRASEIKKIVTTF